MNDACYYRISIKALVKDHDGRVLLCRPDDGQWELLGGGLEHDEDIRVCLTREIHEEAGLEVVEVAPAPSYFFTAPRPGYDTFLAHAVYEVTLANLDFVPSDECRELRFVSLEEMGKLTLFPAARELYEIMSAKQTVI